jgi:uncharacterized protein YutE (UPF0331/DUF86 family)
MDDIKKEIQKLCDDYIEILEQLKDEGLITDETYETCSAQKRMFLDG